MKTLLLENDRVCVSILPYKGCDISSIIYKPLNQELLWKSGWAQNAQPFPQDSLITTEQWVERYEGGYQMLLPNGGRESTYNGQKYGFHGEASTKKWVLINEERSTESHSYTLTTELKSVPFRLVKKIALHNNQDIVSIEDKIEHIGEGNAHFMWGHHIAWSQAILEGARIKLKASKAEVIGEDLSQESKLAQGNYHWPLLGTMSGEILDLSTVPDLSDHHTDNTFISEVEEGHYAIINRKLSLLVEVHWDKERFPYVWFWREWGGSLGLPWQGKSFVYGIEPFSSYPGGLDRVVANGTHLTLKPGEVMESRVDIKIDCI